MQRLDQSRTQHFGLLHRDHEMQRLDQFRTQHFGLLHRDRCSLEMPRLDQSRISTFSNMGRAPAPMTRNTSYPVNNASRSSSRSLNTIHTSQDAVRQFNRFELLVGVIPLSGRLKRRFKAFEAVDLRLENHKGR
eukprot:UN02194